MQLPQIKIQLLEGCNRLASKGFLHAPADSFSLRVPGKTAMALVSGIKDWHNLSVVDVRVVPFSLKDDSSRLHSCIYEQRGDVGAVAVSSPEGARLLADPPRRLPPIFDEQVRHIGPPRFAGGRKPYAKANSGNLQEGRQRRAARGAVGMPRNDSRSCPLQHRAL